MGYGVCPQCGGRCAEIRGKLVCGGCGRIVEGCCEGGPPLGESVAPGPCEAERTAT